jgi:hypothetical protein
LRIKLTSSGDISLEFAVIFLKKYYIFEWQVQPLQGLVSRRTLVPPLSPRVAFQDSQGRPEILDRQACMY